MYYAGMRIAFCYNVMHNNDGRLRELDYDRPETISSISATLEDLGHEVRGIEADQNIFTKLAGSKNQIDAVFNIAEGLYGDARESWVPMACEILQIPYTHSTPTVLALCLNKKLCKLAVSGLGIAVPVDDKFPKIIKPVAEGSSIGIFDDCVVTSQKNLEEKVRKMRKDGIEGELFTEEYIEGREFTVGILGNGENLEVLPIIEQRFDFLPPNLNKIAGYELKWLYEDSLSRLEDAYYCPSDLPKTKVDEIETVSKLIYKNLEIRDCARIDFRMDANGKVYFLEINPLPGINPSEKVISYLPLAGRKAGLSYSQLVDKILNRVVNDQ